MSAAVFPGAEAVLAAARLLAGGAAPALLAIDGRCGSGKSTLAAWLAEQLPCNLVHMDDFYLPMDRRRPDWAEHPGANMDFARLRQEVLAPLLAGSPAQYRAYVCRLGGMAEPRTLPAGGLTLVEGSYALHPDLEVPFACKVFVTCDPACQRRRLQAREGERFEDFARRWIPLEEGYLTACAPEKTCDFVLDTTAMTV